MGCGYSTKIKVNAKANNLCFTYTCLLSDRMKADVPDVSTKGFNPNNNRLSTAIAEIVS
ncbi:hypothetical protein OGM63_17120 [Plectonema radiosum NIES-515]|uniref:Uncharacterized protein n=1 Tax=Plectonema radiosum NIES-515 TaxID=2986073 RepID=A0ABT3B1G7_9CYAN|nr:hypothetical protein [Plectonema radiosum]MCV3215213.1 hypothetical protein [Plectonema radiosum NIES-515]